VLEVANKKRSRRTVRCCDVVKFHSRDLSACIASIRASWFCALVTCAQTVRSVWLALPRVVGWHRRFSDLGGMVRQQCPICWKLLYNASAQSLTAHQSHSRKCLKWQKHYEAEGRSPEPPPPCQSHRAGRSPERECQDANAGLCSPATSCSSGVSEPGDDRKDEWHEVQDADAMGQITPASSNYSADSVPLERDSSISRSSDILRDNPRGVKLRDAEHERQKKLDQTAARQLAGQTNKQHQRGRSQPSVATCSPRMHASSPPIPPPSADTLQRSCRHPRSWGASHKRSSSRNRRRSRSRRDSRSRRRSRIPRGSDDARRQRCSRMPETDDHDRSYVSPQYLSPFEMWIASRTAADHTPSVPGDNVREMATSSGTLSSCPCACRLADAIDVVPIGRKRCDCRSCEFTPECYRLAVQGEDRCEHCKSVIDRGAMRHCGPPEIGLIGIAQARSSSSAMTSYWGSWWGVDGTRLLSWGMLRCLRCETVRINHARIPLTDPDVNMCDILASMLEPKHYPIRESTFGRAIRAMTASRRCEPG
jgi:hypothetical protein